MAAYAMNFVPRGQLTQVPPGHVVTGVRLDPLSKYMTVSDWFLTTSDGLACTNNTDLVSAGCVYTQEVIDSQERFGKIQYIDCGPVVDQRDPNYVPEQV